MQIKAIKEKDVKDTSSAQWILETNNFLIDIVYVYNLDELMFLEKSLESYYNPFDFPSLVKKNVADEDDPVFRERSIVIIRSEDTTPYATLLTNCNVYVTNSSGKTVDSYVAGYLG